MERTASNLTEAGRPPAPSLAQQLEELLQRGDPESFLREVAAHSDLATDTHSDVLAVVDQLYRRRKLSPQLFRLARMGIERRALGFHEAADARNGATAYRHATAQPQRPAAHAERELERMRAELAQARVEAVAQRERAQRLEQQLGQQQDKQQLPPAAPLPRQSQPARPQRGPRTRRLWLIGAGGALAVLAVVLLVTLSGVRHGAVAPSAVIATDATTATAVPPVAAPGGAVAAAPAGELAFETDRYVVGPADRQVVITVRRTAGRAGDVAVEWRAAGGGAQPSRDFLVPVPATLILQERQETAQITIPILRNQARKHTEYFDLRLVRAGGGAVLGRQRRATVFLLPGAGGPRPADAKRAGS